MKTTQCSSSGEVILFLHHHHHHRVQYPSLLKQCPGGGGGQCSPPSAHLTTSAVSTHHFLQICRSRRWDSNAESSYMTKNSDVNSFGADEEEEDEDIMEQWDANLQEFIDSMWIFKVFRSYGWLLPIIILSMVLANGPKAFLLALALPVGLSTFSFAIQKMREEQRTKPKQNTKTKKRSHTRSSMSFEEERRTQNQKNRNTNKARQSWGGPKDNASTMSFEEERRTQNQRNRNTNKARQSWGGPKDNASTDQKVGKNAPSYGGWEELVDIGREYIVDSSGNTDQTTGGSYKRPSQMGELNSKMRKSDRPLLLRLLMTVFPFLGSWI